MRFTKWNVFISFSVVTVTVLLMPILMSNFTDKWIHSQLLQDAKLKKLGFSIDSKVRSIKNLFDTEYHLKVAFEQQKLPFDLKIKAFHGPYFWENGKLNFGFGHMEVQLLHPNQETIIYSFQGRINPPVFLKPGYQFSFPRFTFSEGSNEYELEQAHVKMGLLKAAGDLQHWDVLADLGTMTVKMVGNQILTIEPIKLKLQQAIKLSDDSIVPLAGQLSLKLKGFNFSQKVLDQPIKVLGLGDSDVVQHWDVERKQGSIPVVYSGAYKFHIKDIFVADQSVPAVIFDVNYKNAPIHPFVPFDAFDSFVASAEKQEGQLQRLMQAGARADVRELTVNLPEGFLSVKGFFEFHESSQPGAVDGTQTASNTPLYEKDIMSSKLTFILSEGGLKSALSKIDNQPVELRLKDWSDKQYILKKGLNYESEIEMKSGSILINGKKLSLEQ